jgi:hypothetical protein
LAKRQATLLLRVMQRSQPAKRSPEPFSTRDVVAVEGFLRVVSQSAAAIEFLERKW